MQEKFALLVEDDPDDELLAIRAFSKSPIKKNVIVVRDGEEALDFIFCKDKYAARDIRLQPELILLDLKLPRIDGHQVLEEIRKNEATKLLPVIIFTSSNEESDLQRSYTQGANSYVVKPVDSAEFSKLIQHLSFYWLEINKAAVRES